MKNEPAKPRIALARNAARGIIQEIYIKKPPIQINDIIIYLRKKRKINIELYERDFGKGSRGIQITESTKDGDSLIIAFNKNHHVHSKRFTVAHELGHFLLGHTRDDHSHYFDLFDEKGDKPKEVEANQFAAELLIPLSFLKADVNNEMRNLDQLSSRYWVSKQTMCKKLIDAKLLSKL